MMNNKKAIRAIAIALAVLMAGGTLTVLVNVFVNM